MRENQVQVDGVHPIKFVALAPAERVSVQLKVVIQAGLRVVQALARIIEFSTFSTHGFGAPFVGGGGGERPHCPAIAGATLSGGAA